MRHDLVRVMAEDRRQVQQEIDGTRYNQHDGYFYMKPEHVKAHLNHGNLPTPAAAGPVGRRGGFRCPACGFGSFFLTCSRCGAQCEREAAMR